MKGDGKVKFDQGIVADNNDPERLGRIKVRMVSDGVDVKETMRKGDSELYWYEPCILGAGYEVGSLTIPPVGSFVWCIECEFNTENVYRVYLGSSYGSGPTNSKTFNEMLTPPGVIETPTEALLDYPYTQLLYKSTSGSYMRFYGDSLSGFDICTGIPTRDADGNYISEDNYTYNYLYGDREEITFSISEMPDPQDKADPEEPEDTHISYITLNSDEIFSGVVRDRLGDTFNKQEITPSGIYMTVRGTGGTTSPSENKDLQEAAQENVAKSNPVAEKATEQATEDVSKKDGVLDTQNKVLDNKTEQVVNKAVNSPCKLSTKETGMSKKDMSMFQDKIKELSYKLPGGYGFIQSTVSSAIQGNTKAVMYHLLSTVSSTVFSLASALLRDVFNDILSNPKIINTEEASKFVDLIIGEANLNKLTGKASEMITMIGGKLGPFGQVFERVANTILGVASSKLGIINQINNKIAGIASMKQMFDQIKPTVTQLLETGLETTKQSTSKMCIDVFNQSLSTGTPYGANIKDMAFAAMSLNLEGQMTGNKSGTASTSDNSGTASNTSSADTPKSSTAQQTTSNEQPTAESETKLTKDEEKTVEQLSEMCVNCMKEAVTESADNIVNALISKTLNNASEETKVSSDSTTEFENIIYLDADGARAVIPGEEITNCAIINNDGAQVHVGEECLFQMTPSNIMQFVSDPDYENQSTFIQASDGFETKVNTGEMDKLEIKSSAEKNETIVSNGIQTSTIIQEPNKITLQVGQSKIELSEHKIDIISDITINVYAKEGVVNLGAGVNLGYTSAGIAASGVVCNWAVEKLNSKVTTTWKIPDGMAIHFQ